MIGHLRGTVLEKHPNEVTVDVAGVGYHVQIPVSTFTALPDVGGVVGLRIHTYVREDALSLFGFATAHEKLVFERLISVSGIGPKLAIMVLSGLPAEELVAAIRRSDVQTLIRIPGVGKKTAERMILELKDKLLSVSPALPGAPPSAPATSHSALEEDVLSALQNLGSSRASAEEAVRKAKDRGAPDEFEPLFRAALALVR